MDKYLTSASCSSSVSPSVQKRKETLQQNKKSSTKKVCKEKTTEKNKPHTRLNWNPNWPQAYPWNSKGIFVVRTKNFKKNYLDMYITTKKHQKAALEYTDRPSDQTDLVIGFTIQADIDKLDVIAKMQCVYLCAKKHFAIDAFSNLVELVNIQEKNKTELVFEQPPITLLLSSFGPKKDLIISDNPSNQTNYSTYKNPMADIDSEFILATKFLADILFTFSNLTRIFQSDYITLSDVHIQLNAVIDSITTEFIGSGDDPNDIDYISPTYRNHL
ncbi:19222_t:CDS:2 [Funneliformis geosporum]|nr:19222_t:CDS:2 [Funneliformis geosporum]